MDVIRADCRPLGDTRGHVIVHLEIYMGERSVYCSCIPASYNWEIQGDDLLVRLMKQYAPIPNLKKSSCYVGADVGD